MMGAWSNHEVSSDESSSDEENKAHICVMENEDDHVSIFPCCSRVQVVINTLMRY